MTYIGKYYEDKGYKTGIYIPKLDYNIDASVLIIRAINNVDKTSMSWDVSVNQENSTYFYYNFIGLDTTSISEGEYTLYLYTDGVEAYSGLMSYRNSTPVNSSVYDNPTEYVVYGQN